MLLLSTPVCGSDKIADESSDQVEATDAKKKRPPKHEEQMVVTATRGERPAELVPISVSVISEKEIEESPAVRLDDFLREVPGLDLSLGSSAVHYPSTQLLSMRGLGGNRALVLLDGIPLNDPANGSIPWSKIPMSSIDRIEVARGAAASLFGNYSLGGTIQLFSRDLRDRLDGEVSYGSYDTRRVAVSAAKTINDRFAIGADIHISDSDGFDRVPALVRGPIDIPVASDHATFQLRSEFTTDRTRSFALARFFTEDLSLGTPLSKNARDIIDVSAGTHVAIGAGDLSVSVFHQNQEFWVQNTSLVRRESEFLLNRRTTPILDTGGSIQWFATAGPRIPFFTVGLDLRHIELEEDGINFDSSGSVTSLQTVGGTQSFAGLFAEASVMISPRVELLTSARLDAWENRDGFDDRSVGEDRRYPSKRLTELDPRVAVHYAASSTVSLRGAVYRAFRAPTISELYRRTEAKAQVNLPNPDLEPEILVGGDVGVDARIGGADASLNLFHSEIEGLIGRIPLEITPVLIQKTVNLARTRSQGIEAMVSRDFGQRWSARLGLTFNDSVTIDNPADERLEGLRTPGVSKHMEMLSVRYRSAAGPAVTLRGRSIGNRYADAGNSLELDAHLVFDLFASLPLSHFTELFVVGENLLDETYLADVAAAQRLGGPRQLFGGIRLRIRGSMD